MEKLVDVINTREIRWLDLHFFTPDCRLKHLTVRATNDSKKLADGFVLDPNVLPNVAPPIVLTLDDDTYAVLPWENNTMRVICDIQNGEDRGRCLRDPRYVIERVMLNYKSLGLEALLAPAISFFLFDSCSFSDADPLGPRFFAESRESPRGANPLTSSDLHYHLYPQDQFGVFRAQVADLLEHQFRYVLRNHHHGEGAFGKQAFCFDFHGAKTAADAVESLKFVSKALAAMNGHVATFMPLPFSELSPARQTLLIRVKRGREDLFVEEGESAEAAIYFIGGILEHAQSLALFTLPTANSYKALRKRGLVVGWGDHNSIVNVVKDPSGIAVEVKLLDSSSFPYLAYAAVLAAGLDGLKKKISPPESERKGKRKYLPKNLTEAISAFESDPGFVKGVIPPEFLEVFLEHKIREIDALASAVSAEEARLYLDV